MGWGFEIGLLVAILVAIWLLVMWLGRLSKKRKSDAHFKKLREVAQQASGHVTTDEQESTPRSATLLSPFSGRDDGVYAFSTVRAPRYDHAISVRRGRWQVRAAQASRVVASPSSPGNGTTSYSYRIEIELAPCTPLKVSPIVEHSTRRNEQGQPERMVVRDDELQQPPAGHDAGQWSQLPLPGRYAEQFQAFAADHRSAAEVLNEDSLEWLAQYISQVKTVWAIENGLLYVNILLKEIDPDTIISQIDALVGFLDRTPIQPGDTSERGSQQGRAQA